MMLLSKTTGLIVLLFATISSSDDQTGYAAIRWCCANKEALTLCRMFVEDLKLVGLKENASLSFDFSCVHGRHRIDCMEKISHGKADIMALDPKSVYIAGKYFDLRVLLTETIEGSNSGGLVYPEETVVVIRKSAFPSSKLTHFRGKSICLSGIGDQNLQYHALINVLIPLGIIPSSMRNCSSVIDTLSNFVGPSCSPGQWTTAKAGLDVHQKLCTLCNDRCDDEDEFAGPTGAVTCLTVSNADVAVTTKQAVEQSSLNSDEFGYLCLQGSISSLNESCSWLVLQNWAYVTSGHVSQERKIAIKDAIRTVFRLFNGNPSSVWFRQLLFPGGRSVSGVRDVYFQSTYERFLGRVFVRSMEAAFPSVWCQEPLLRWCVEGKQLLQKCQHVMMAWESTRTKPKMSCVLGRDIKHCAQLIDEQQADILIARADLAVQFFFNYNLTPIAFEVSDDDVAVSGYLVAVVRSNGSVTLDRLYGLKVCFGWSESATTDVYVMNVLAKFGLLSMHKCNWQQAKSDFFRITACSSTGRTQYGTLCDFCTTEKAMKSARHYLSVPDVNGQVVASEPEIAFLQWNELTNSAVTDADDSVYHLLCLNGLRKPLSDYRSCHWLRIPSRSVMTSATFKTTSEKTAIVDILLRAELRYRQHYNDGFSMYATRADKRTLFAPSTVTLKPTSPNVSEVEMFGAQYFDIQQQTIQCTASSSSSTSCSCHLHYLFGYVQFYILYRML